jgi:hypothetical protein
VYVNVRHYPLFGYYHNEEQAQVYYSASDSINALIIQSEKRYVLLSNSPKSTTINCADLTSVQKNDLTLGSTTKKCSNLTSAQGDNLISKLTTKNCGDLVCAQEERNELIKSRDNIQIPQDAKSLANQAQTMISADTISALGKAVDETSAKIAEAQGKIDLANKRQQNLDLLINSGNLTAYEAGCLNEDVDDVMHRVRVHLSLLDPQHVSEDLKHIKAATGKTDNDSSSATPPTAFDLSDLDPKKIVSV